MGVEVHDYVLAPEKLTNFGISLPNEIAILPGNLETASSINDLRQHVESDTVRKLLKQNKINYVEIFSDENQPLYLQQYSFEWFGPTLFISAGLLSQNPNILSITLGLITNYLYDLFQGRKDGKASLDVVYQQADGSCKKISYTGPSEGLSQITDIIQQLENKS